MHTNVKTRRRVPSLRAPHFISRTQSWWSELVCLTRSSGKSSFSDSSVAVACLQDFYRSYALPSSSSHVSTARSLSAELFFQPASFIDYFLTVLLVGTIALKFFYAWGVSPSPPNWAAENISRGFWVRILGTAGLGEVAQDPPEVAFKVSPGIRVYFKTLRVAEPDHFFSFPTICEVIYNQLSLPSAKFPYRGLARIPTHPVSHTNNVHLANPSQLLCRFIFRRAQSFPTDWKVPCSRSSNFPSVGIKSAFPF